jgi:hypothetical protein
LSFVVLFFFVVEVIVEVLLAVKGVLELVAVGLWCGWCRRVVGSFRGGRLVLRGRLRESPAQ